MTMMHKRLILEKGPFNNYVDKMGGGSKNGKILST